MKGKYRVNRQWVKELMAVHGMTQANLAEAMGSHQSSISLWLGGKKEMRYDTLWRMARALNCDPDAICEEVSGAVRNVVEEFQEGGRPADGNSWPDLEVEVVTHEPPVEVETTHQGGGNRNGHRTPHYYRLPFVDADGGDVDLGHVIDHYGLDYWLASAVVHICRAGRKEGESVESALENALRCLERGVRG